MSTPILTPELIERFQDDGYVVVPNVFEPDELASFGGAVDEAVAGRASSDHRTLAEKTTYEQSFIQCINLWEDTLAVRRLTFDPRLGEIAARTTGFSGASLENLLNEAAIVAARRNATSISYKEVRSRPRRQTRHR